MIFYRQREDHASPSLSASVSCDWTADGLHPLARNRGSDADTLVRSLYSRLATAVDTADILVLAQNEEGGAGTVSANGGLSRTSPLSPCPVLLLIGFFNSILDIVGDCEDGCHQECGSTEMSETAVAVVSRDADFRMGAQGAILRSALASLAEFLLAPQAMAGDASLENSRPEADIGGRSLLDRAARNHSSQLPAGFDGLDQEKTSESPVSCGIDTAVVAPIPQLVTLRFLHQAMLRWPRITVELMHELDLWDIFFSERFLSGGSYHVTRAIEGLHETEAAAGSYTTAATRCPDKPSGLVGGSEIGDGAVGWGLMYDGVLLLLEAVVVVRCVLQLGPEKLVRERNEKVGSCAVGDQGSGAARPLEIEQYVSFLARGGSSCPCSIVAMQGCRWLRAVVVMESAVGTSLLLPPPLRVTTLCLAFQLCGRGNGAGPDALITGKVLRPLVHASLSLAVALVTSSSKAQEEGFLLEAAVAYAADAEVAAGGMAAAPAKPRAHHPTASMTSDTSSPGAHAPNSWWTPSSGGSRTPASNNSGSPRAGPSLSFVDTQVPPTPTPPRPLPEVLFKAALDPRVRRAVFHLSVMLGIEAGRGAVTPLDVHQRVGGGVWDFGADSFGVQETATAVVSGVVEGFLCLCERAAVATVASGATDDGPGLLLDALHGACGLVRSGAPQSIVSTGGASTSSGDDTHGGLGEARIGPSMGRVWGGDAVSPLLQEAFREHWASARLLIVLESVVGSPSVSRSTPNSPAVTMETCSDIVTASLSLFTAMMSGNSLGKRAFRRALSEHYAEKKIASGIAPSSPHGGASGTVDGGAVNEGSSFIGLAYIVSVVPPTSLCRVLMKMLMDGEDSVCVIEAIQAEDGGESAKLDGASTRRVAGHKGGSDGRDEPPPEIRNPFVVPLIFRMLPDWPISEQARIMKVFRLLLRGAGGGMVNRSLCCDVQPALMDQV